MSKSSRKKRGKGLQHSTQGKLTIRQILAWADAHHKRTGRWPKCTDGPIRGSGGERWQAVQSALRHGSRGLSGGTSLAILLATRRGVPYHIRAVRGRLLTKKQIMAWARAHYARTGVWPSRASGAVVGILGENWNAIAGALHEGCRGLPAGGSIAQLIGRRVGDSRNLLRPKLTAKQVLAWADKHRQRTGKWPKTDSGPVLDAQAESWGAINAALRVGIRGFKGDYTLARLLARYRGTPIRRISTTPLTIKQILAWADAHHRRTGKWPTSENGRINNTQNETWGAVRAALRVGTRGMPGGTTLAWLLHDHRNVAYPIGSIPGRRLSKKQILAWAKAHHQRTGLWPSAKRGSVHGVEDETWPAIGQALRQGCRGLPGGDSLAKLIGRRPGTDRNLLRPKLTQKQILTWADAHRQKTGRWPNQCSGPVLGVAGESWGNIHRCMSKGNRGLRQGISLSELLAKYRGVPPHPHKTDRLTIKLILSWADAHWDRTGHWPGTRSGRIAGTEAETWQSVNSALQYGYRGLQRGWSLVRLLAAKRGRPYQEQRTAPLTAKQILRWADSHRKQTGEYPTPRSGPVGDAPGEDWGNIDRSLKGGHRSLPRGSSLTRLLAKHRGVRNTKALPDLSTELILAWADAYLKRTGEVPVRFSGPIPESNGESWMSVADAMRLGKRGMKGGVSLAQLLEGRGPRVNRDRPKPKLTSDKIVLWAKAHCRRTGNWPDEYAGRVTDAPDEAWWRINSALSKGQRGLAGGSSLAELLKGRRKPKPLSIVPRRHRLRV